MRSIAALSLVLSVFATRSSAQNVVFAEDFESGYANWSMDSLWNAQEASESCTANLAPFPSGTHAVWYGSSTTCDYDPSDWGNHYLTLLQPIVLPTTSGVLELRFRSNTRAEEDGTWDLRQAQVSTNDGVSWTKVGDVFNGYPSWRTDVFDLTQFQGSTIRLRFRFWAGDAATNYYIGWLMDDIQVLDRNDTAIANCLGDGSWRNCPCDNTGSIGRGCASSFNPNGARLSATGFASVSNDTLEFTAEGMSTAAATIIQASANFEAPNYSLGGDGWMCMRAPYARIRTIAAPAGAVAYPAGSDVPISVRGGVPPTGGLRFYTVRYRNAVSFCTTSTFNATNGLAVTWRL